MKRALFLVPVPLVSGAALWSVNWKVDHPPLSSSDREVTASFSQAQTADIFELSCQQQQGQQQQGQWNIYSEVGSHNTQQTLQLRQLSRVENASSTMPDPGGGIVLDITLMNGRKAVDTIQLCQTKKHTLVWNARRKRSWYLHPRFEQRLRGSLDASVRQRLQP